MKVLISFFIILSSLFANELKLAQEYIVDKNNSLTINQLIKNKNIFQSIEKYNLGSVKDNIWLYIPLKNTSNTIYEKRIHNKRAGLDYIDVFIVKNNKIIKTYSLGDMRDYKDRDNIFRISYFDIKLQPLEKIDIFIKQKSYSSMDLRWNIEDINSFENYYNTQAVVYALITGMLSVTILATLMLYLFLKNKFYLIYASFTLGVILYQLALAGFFYQFKLPLYLITIFNFPIPVIVLILFGLFPFYFFDIRKNEFKIILSIIKILMIILLFLSVSELFYPLNYELLYNSRYTNIISFALILTLLILSIKAFIAKKRSAIFYLLSNLVQFCFATSYLLVLSGLIKYSDYYYYTLATGVIGQDIFLALALVQSTYLIKKENDKNDQLLNEYSKLSFIGQTMINISHQWKTPINSIYNRINHIEAAREFKDPNIDKIIDINMQNIKETTLYLKDTAISQLDFYKDKSKKENINIYQEVQFVINLIQNEFTKKDIDIHFNCDKNLNAKIQKNYFLNLLMILFENSFKIFEKRDIKNPHIIIDIQIVSNYIKINFQDNAKGTNEDTINKIFDKDNSNSNSTGIGLYLAKEIVTYKLKGNITAQNTQNGILFKIKYYLS